MATSRFPRFYELSHIERLQAIVDWARLTPDDVQSLQTGGLGVEVSSDMVENVIGTIEMPLGVSLNLIVNGHEYVVPMAVEEASVIAAASNGAKLARKKGGFRATSGRTVMIGQVQVLDLLDAIDSRSVILRNKRQILEAANRTLHKMVDRGGGAIDVDARVVSGHSDGMLIVHILIDTCDAMGANAVNSAVEAVAPLIAELSGGRIGVRILSNFADGRVVNAYCCVPASEFGEDGTDAARKIVEASDFAKADYYRAATHNKGIMNAIDAVCVATGNDWRAVEAAAHAYASRMGTYTPLSAWELEDNGDLIGRIELPVPVGIVGGATRAHPVARAALKILGVRSATELAQVMAAVGLAENLASLRALALDGIQKGHMRLHARQIALAAGARGDKVGLVALQMIQEERIGMERALEILSASEPL